MARATAPVVGVALMLAITVALASVVGATALALEPREPGPQVTLSVMADAGTDRITLTHEGGDALDVRELELSIRVDGEPLAHQPPIPYFAARGFHGTPTGPFNQGGDPQWSAGEEASLQIASTNDPTLSAADRVTVVLSTNRRVLARTETGVT